MDSPLAYNTIVPSIAAASWVLIRIFIIGTFPYRFKRFLTSPALFSIACVAVPLLWSLRAERPTVSVYAAVLYSCMLIGECYLLFGHVRNNLIKMSTFEEEFQLIKIRIGKALTEADIERERSVQMQAHINQLQKELKGYQIQLASVQASHPDALPDIRVFIFDDPSGIEKHADEINPGDLIVYESSSGAMYLRRIENHTCVAIGRDQYLAAKEGCRVIEIDKRGESK